LAPLLPQLAFAIRRRAGTLPPELQGAGGHGGRHIATLISLSVTGPTTVSELSVSDKAKPALARLRDRHAAVLAAFLVGFGDDEEASRFIDQLTELVACLNTEADAADVPVPKGQSSPATEPAEPAAPCSPPRL
jgi:hypothetical protein